MGRLVLENPEGERDAVDAGVSTNRASSAARDIEHNSYALKAPMARDARRARSFCCIARLFPTVMARNSGPSSWVTPELLTARPRHLDGPLLRAMTIY